MLPPMLLYLIACLLLTLTSSVTLLLSQTWLHTTFEYLLQLSFISAPVNAVCSRLKPVKSFDKPHIQNLQYMLSAPVDLSGPEWHASVLLQAFANFSTMHLLLQVMLSTPAGTLVPHVPIHHLFHAQWSKNWRYKKRPTWSIQSPTRYVTISVISLYCANTVSVYCSLACLK